MAQLTPLSLNLLQYYYNVNGLLSVWWSLIPSDRCYRCAKDNALPYSRAQSNFFPRSILMSHFLDKILFSVHSHNSLFLFPVLENLLQQLLYELLVYYGWGAVHWHFGLQGTHKLKKARENNNISSAIAGDKGPGKVLTL